MNTIETRPILNSEDVIDSRDVIARIAHLVAAWADATGDSPDDYQLSRDDWAFGLGDAEANELCDLIALQGEAEGSPDWQYGEVLIHDDHFQDYARELAEDIGAVNTDAGWPNAYIDWEAAARALRIDYISVDFGGATYWIRG